MNMACPPPPGELNWGRGGPPCARAEKRQRSRQKTTNDANNSTSLGLRGVDRRYSYRRG